jgi:hypothetical protein
VLFREIAENAVDVAKLFELVEDMLLIGIPG